MLILHGENLAASRLALGQKTAAFKKQGGEVIVLAFPPADLTLVLQSLEATSILASPRLVVVENLLSSPASVKKEKILRYLKSTAPSNLILWEKKKIDGRTLLSFRASIDAFNPNPAIFRFLDSLTPESSRNSIYWFHQSLIKDSPELILFMLGRQIKNLILAADLGPRGLTAMPDWRKGKLVIQAKRFGLPRLLEIYRQLLDIEYQQKSGQAPLPLSSHLDLWLAGL